MLGLCAPAGGAAAQDSGIRAAKARPERKKRAAFSPIEFSRQELFKTAAFSGVNFQPIEAAISSPAGLASEAAPRREKQLDALETPSPRLEKTRERGLKNTAARKAFISAKRWGNIRKAHEGPREDYAHERQRLKRRADSRDRHGPVQDGLRH
jgi:hypothetical protein